MLIPKDELDQLDDDAPVDGGDGVTTAANYRQHVSELIQSVQMDVVKQRDEWVQARRQTGVEERWARAKSLYYGDDSVDSSFVEQLKTGSQQRRKSNAAEQPRSRVVVNIVRPKVDQAVARMCEILLPVDDRNWGIRPTPVAETISAMLGDKRQTVDAMGQDTGRTADTEARMVMESAKKSASAMERTIDDALTECGYNGQQRQLIEDGVRLGSGVLKSPILVRQSSSTWMPGVQGQPSKRVVKEAIQPAAVRVDPWDVWFDPSCGNDHQRGAGVWHRRYVTRRELRALVGIPGYDSEAIREVLRQPPTRVVVADGRVTRNTSTDKSYELWEYHGEIEPDCMTMCSYGTGDPLEDVDFGVLLVVENRVISAMESWVVDRTLPYDVWTWRKADDSPFGYGLCDELAHQQSVVTTAWRQVMDNARTALGAQVVYRKGIKPQDGNYTIGGGIKLWEIDPDAGLDDVKKAFDVYEFPAHLQDLLAIAKTAMELADAETGMPQLMNGEQGSASETVGGMVMLFNNASAVLRLRVKLYDDTVTRPAISRLYDYFMDNSEDEAIKGDFEVDARGSTSLLEKDIQNQATLNLSNITSNPRYAGLIDAEKELKVILKAFKINPEDVMLSDDKIRAMQENPPQAPADPRIEAAQIMAETKKLELQDRAAAREIDAQIQREEAQVKREGLAYNAAREEAESFQSQRDAQLEREIAIAKLQQDGVLTADEMAQRERMQALDLSSKHQLFNAEAALRTQTGQGI